MFADIVPNARDSAQWRSERSGCKIFPCVIVLWAHERFSCGWRVGAGRHEGEPLHVPVRSATYRRNPVIIDGEHMHGYEHDEEGGGEECGCHHGHGMCHGKQHKEFKLAMLEKKEKMLQAKLDFIRKIRGIVEKSSDEDGE